MRAEGREKARHALGILEIDGQYAPIHQNDITIKEGGAKQRAINGVDDACRAALNKKKIIQYSSSAKENEDRKGGLAALARKGESHS